MATVDNNARLDALKNDRKFINKCLLHYFWGDTACFTFEMMMAPGIIEMMLKAGEDLYPGDEAKQIELVQNHNVFFNTQPNMTIVPGTVMGLEIERAKGNDVPNDVIQAIKAALAGSFAGIGDSIIQGIVVPTLLSIGMGISANGSPLGPIFVWLAFFGIFWPVAYYLFKLGLDVGADGASSLLEGELKDRFVNAITILGCIVVGAVTASTVNPQFALMISEEKSLQSALDGIYPGLTAVLFLGVVYFLMTKKKIGALPMLGILFVFAVVASVIGLM